VGGLQDERQPSAMAGFMWLFSVSSMSASEFLMPGLSTVPMLKEWCPKFTYSNNIRIMQFQFQTQKKEVNMAAIVS